MAETKKTIFIVMGVLGGIVLFCIWLWVVYGSVFKQVKDASGF